MAEQLAATMVASRVAHLAVSRNAKMAATKAESKVGNWTGLGNDGCVEGWPLG